MKTKLLIIILGLLTIFSKEGNAQSCAGNLLEVCIVNITQTGPGKLEMDLTIKNIGSTSICLSELSGSITYPVGLVPLGATMSFSMSKYSMFSNLNNLTTTHMSVLRRLMWSETPSSTCVLLSGPGSTAISHPFAHITLQLNGANVWPTNFFVTFLHNCGQSSTIQNMNASVLCNGNAMSTNLTCPSSLGMSTPCLTSLMLNALSLPCPSSMGIIPTNSLCFGSNGTATIDMGITNTPILGGTYSLNGGAPINFTGNPFTISNLASGAYSIVVTPDSCTSMLDTFTITNSNTPNSSNISQTACDSFIWSSNGQTYNVSGIYTNAYVNANGCAVYDTLNLTIFPSTNSLINDTACTSYFWNVNGQTYTTSGTYFHTDACVSDTLNLVVTPINLSVTQSGITLLASATSSTYQWINCTTGLPIAGATNSMFTPSLSGIYKVASSNGICSDTSTCYTVTNVGIKQSFISEIGIAANPSTGTFTISSDVDLKNASIIIYATTGEVVLEQNEINDKNVTVDLSAYSNGIYFMKLVQGSEVAMIKLMKQ